MSSVLTQKEQEQIAQWVGYKAAELTLLFSAQKHDGLSASKFRSYCKDKGQCVVVFVGSNGNVYGFYTAVGFIEADVYQRDDRCFFFTLREKNKEKFQIFFGKAGNVYVNQHNTHGPHLCDKSGENGLCAFTGDSSQASSYDMHSLNFDLFKLGSSTGDKITGNSQTVSDVAVYSILFSQAVNDLKSDLVKFVSCLEEIKHTNILLVGPVSSGKSSYFNTLSSCFRGHVRNQAPTGNLGRRVTTKFHKYRMKDFESQQQLRFQICDTMSIEEAGDRMASDVPYILDGHIPDNFQLVSGAIKQISSELMSYRMDRMISASTDRLSPSLQQLCYGYLASSDHNAFPPRDDLKSDQAKCHNFNPITHLSPKSPGFNYNPKLADGMHTTAFVLDCSNVNTLSEEMWSKLENIKQHCDQRSIPTAAILTGIDKMSPNIRETVSVVFFSPEVHEAVDFVAKKLGLSRNKVHPVKNYESETQLEVATDILALSSLRQLLRLAEDYFDGKALNPDDLPSRAAESDDEACEMNIFKEQG